MKYGYFIPYKKESRVEKLAYMFLRTVIINHQMPKSIITDRGSLFMSHFWKMFTSLLGTKTKLSTVYYPQTDGQTERLNQTLEQYLRCYINYKQDNWVTLFPMTQFAYNSGKNATIERTPFYANYGFEPTMSHESLVPKQTPQEAVRAVGRLKNLHEQLARDIKFTLV